MLNDYESGFAVMNKDLTGYSLDGLTIKGLMPYCRNDDVIVEWIPKRCGISISIQFLKWYRPMIRKHYLYIHKAGKVVFKNE